MIKPEVKLNEGMLTKVVIKNAVLSFPQLDKPVPFKTSKPRYGASFILPKDDTTIARLNTAMLEAVKLKIEDKDKAILAVKKAKASAKTPVGDGDVSGREELEDKLIIRGYTYEDRPPMLLLPNRKAVPEKMVNQIFYPGCHVDAVVNFYYSAEFNTICSSLRAVQFRADGVRLGGGTEVSVDDFDEIETDSDFSFGVDSDGVQSIDSVDDDNIGF